MISYLLFDFIFLSIYNLKLLQSSIHINIDKGKYMGNHLLVYTVSCDNDFKQDASSLQSRWKNDKVWRDFRQDLINAIHTGDDIKVQSVLSRKNFLMTVHSNLSYEKKFEVVDLRGIELKNLEVKEFDFAYCCFDFALLTNVIFNQTFLQYSSFNNTVIKKSTFLTVQASPISSLQAKWEDVKVEAGYFMYSDFKGTSFIRSDIPTMD